MLPPLATGISGAAASALLLPPSLSPGAAAAAAASAAGTSEHALHAADAIARGYLQGDEGDRGRHVFLPCFNIATRNIKFIYYTQEKTKIFYFYKNTLDNIFTDICVNTLHTRNLMRYHIKSLLLLLNILLVTINIHT